MFNIIDINYGFHYNLSMENLVNIGQSLKEKRLFLNLPMEYVAKKAQITRATLWSIENGRGNYSINSLLSVMDVLSLNLEISSPNAISMNRERASRVNTALDKKINRFVIMCVEQYCFQYQEEGEKIYKKMKENGVIKELTEDYEDLHGMSTLYLNEYIHSLLER